MSVRAKHVSCRYSWKTVFSCKRAVSAAGLQGKGLRKRNMFVHRHRQRCSQMSQSPWETCPRRIQFSEYLLVYAFVYCLIVVLVNDSVSNYLQMYLQMLWELFSVHLQFYVYDYAYNTQQPCSFSPSHLWSAPSLFCSSALLLTFSPVVSLCHSSASRSRARYLYVSVSAPRYLYFVDQPQAPIVVLIVLLIV